MNICLFGGAFDPPHIGHLQVVIALLENKLVDEVWFLPAKNHPFGKEMVEVVHRLAMLEELKAVLSLYSDTLAQQVKIEMYEIDQEGMSYSYQSLLALQKKYPQHTFSFVIGSDNLQHFHKWYGFPELLAFSFYVYPREGYSFFPLYENMIPLENMDTVNVSSTQIKEAILDSQLILDLVPSPIIEYITEHNLYS